MAFPSNPTNLQVSTNNGINWIYYSNIGTWQRLSSGSSQIPISVSSTLTVTNDITAQTNIAAVGNVSANFYSGSGNITTTAGNIRTTSGNLISLSGSVVAANVITTNGIYYPNNVSASNPVAAGSDTNLQFNDGGTSFGGATNLRYVKATGNVVISTTTTSSSTTTGALVISGGVGIGGALNITGAITGSSTISDGIGNVRNLPINSQTSAYVIASTDAGKLISITTGGVTINSGVLSAGQTVSIYNNSGVSQTITQGTATVYLVGTATTGNRTLAQRGLATLISIDGTTFVISGGGLN